MAGIYKITFTNNQYFYIGATTRDFQIRWKEHSRSLKKKQGVNFKFQNVYNKYGDSMQFEILEEINEINSNIFDEAEQKWIDKLWDRDYCLNINKNIKNGLGWKLFLKMKSKESREMASFRNIIRWQNPIFRQKMSDISKKSYQDSPRVREVLEIGRKTYQGPGVPKSEKQKKSLSESKLIFYQTEEGKKAAKTTAEKNKGKKVSDRVKQAVSRTHKGKPKSSEQRRKMSDSAKGRDPTPQAHQASVEKCSKPILQYDLNGNLLNEYCSVIEAKRKTGFDKGTIRKCANGLKESWKGFIFKWKG